MNAVLAIDLGTSSAKGALYGADGTRLALARVEYPVAHPGSGMSEQNPRDYLDAAARIRHELAGEHRVCAIGLSTQTPTLVFADDAGNALGPAILWQDTRAGEEAVWLRQVDEATRCRWFGLDLPTGAASTPAKLLWVKSHAPEMWRRTRWVLQPKDFLALHLTGQATTDHWCAKGIGHFATGQVHPEYLDRNVCPPMRYPYEVNGRTADGIPVSVGWSDAMAGILATGAWHEPRAFVLSGTSEIVGVSGRGFARAPGLFHVPAAVLDLFGLELHYGPTEAGGASLAWLAAVMDRTPEQLLAMVARRGPNPILFRPYLNGERAPYWDHTLSAGFEGLRAEHSAADIVHAVLQGVALHERLVLQTAGAAEPVALAGGGARDAGWNQLRADVLQRRVEVSRDPETSLRGAALLAWDALEPGILRKPPESWFAGDALEPDRAHAEAYGALYERFVLRQ